MTRSRRISIIGCGTVGSALGALFFRKQLFSIGQIINRTTASAARAAAFIGAGSAGDLDTAIVAADIFLIATPEREIEAVAHVIAQSAGCRSGTIVFHVSGARSSADLRHHFRDEVFVASVHPAKSFPDAAAARDSFAGTLCAAEGDDEALAVLIPAFSEIGGSCFRIAPSQKAEYHSALVIGSNYVVALADLALRTLVRAGVKAEMAHSILRPLMSESLENAFRLGPAAALTGPIARGDIEVVREQLNLLAAADPLGERVYRALGLVAAGLAGRSDQTEGINALLSEPNRK